MIGETLWKFFNLWTSRDTLLARLSQSARL